VLIFARTPTCGCVIVSFGLEVAVPLLLLVVKIRDMIRTSTLLLTIIILLLTGMRRVRLLLTRIRRICVTIDVRLILLLLLITATLFSTNPVIFVNTCRNSCISDLGLGLDLREVYRLLRGGYCRWWCRRCRLFSGPRR